MKKMAIAVTAILLAGLGRAWAYEDGDFQVWHTENQEWKINDKFKMTGEQELRLGDGGGDFYYQHYDIGLVYAFNKHLDLGINYRQVEEEKNRNFRPEERPHINATVKWDMIGFKMDDRNRFEYRHFSWQKDSWRYRNKFTVKFPWKFTFLNIQPYLADEIFVKLDGIDLNRNRFYSGIGFDITENIKGEIYYLLQSSKSSGTWVKANVLGSKLKLLF